MFRRPAFARTALAALSFVFLAGAVQASGTHIQPGQAGHGLSAFGALKYPAGFKHFDYVNPDAPKGGRIATIGTSAITTFDSFNPFILRGNAAQGLVLLFDTLMTRAADEPDSVYGLVASEATLAADRLSVTFKLRPEAKFADGTQIKASDVAFSFKILKEKGHPRFRIQLRDATAADAIDASTVRYTFTGTQLRDLPLTVAQLPILSEAYYTRQPFDQTSFEPPLGSGPYKIADYKQGEFVSYVRRADYWARDLNVMRGRFNFDEIRYEYFRDRGVELQNLKAGRIDLREEFTAKDWVTAYDTPAVREGRLKQLALPDSRPSGAQGYFINTRRAKFADVRTRKALDLAFDYEWTNANVFNSLYVRTQSYFENSDFKASGKPAADELALLEPLRADLPAAVFEEIYVPPVTDGSGKDRRGLAQAAKLLDEAGWQLKDGRRVNAKGETLEIEFLITDPTSERILGPYTTQRLNLIGIATSIRRIDPAQYEMRLKAFDFDIVTQRYVMSLTPGSELRDIMGSEAAGADGSRNLAGIRSPAIDTLITKVLEAKIRSELVTIMRALDRVLRAGHYWVPHWYKASHHIAYWDKFDRPATKPAYDPGVLDTWWFNAEKAKTLAQN
jgi:microcin C transport system substrate-binding protein